MTPTVTTRSATALESVLINLFDADDESHPLRRAIAVAGITNIDELVQMDRETLLSIQWSDKEGVGKIPIAMIDKVKWIDHWFNHLEPGAMVDASYKSLNQDTLTSHRRQAANRATTVVVSAPSSVPERTVLSAADEFKKSIRRSTTSFVPLKDKMKFFAWRRGFEATARSQGLNNILNEDYKPATPEEQGLFENLQNYSFDVLLQVLLEPMSQNIASRYSVPNTPLFGDAQALYAAVTKAYTMGTWAQLSRDRISQSLSSTKLDSNWNKGITKFLIQFNDNVQTLRQLEQYPGSHTSNPTLIDFLRGALQPHEKMSSFLLTFYATRVGNNNEDEQTFEHFYNIAFDMASTLDNNEAKNTTNRRTISNADSSADNNSDSVGDNAGRSNRSSRNRGRRGNGAQGTEGRGSGSGATNNGGRGGNATPTVFTDEQKIDPSVYLPENVFRSLTPEQFRTRQTRRDEQREARIVSAVTRSFSEMSGIPPTINVNSANVPSSDTVITQGTNNPGAVLRHMLSASQAQASQAQNTSQDLYTINGSVYQRRANYGAVYRINETERSGADGALLDSGANGGLLGSDARVLETDLLATADVIGITNDILESLPIVQAAAKIETVDNGFIIGIFSSYAKRNDGGRTIHSKGQLEAFGVLVDERSRIAGGTQCVVTNEGYVVPLRVRDGLSYMDMSPPSDNDLLTLPHVYFCADSRWDPSCLDNEDSVDAIPSVALERRDAHDRRVDDFGNMHVSHAHADFPVPRVDSVVLTLAVVVRTAFALAVSFLAACPQTVTPKLPDMDTLRPHFGWVPVDRIKRTLEKTTQYYRATVHHPFRKHFKSRFPAANVNRLNEWFATDTVFSDTPAADDGIPGHAGCKMVQLYAGMDSHYLAAYPMRTESEMPSTMEDFIRDHGAMQGLFSDNAKVQVSQAVKNIQRMYCIKDAQNEPHYEHQSNVERRVQDVKRLTKNVMDCTGCPAPYWLLAVLFVVSLMNHMVNVNDVIPHSAVTGQATDISQFLSFHFWQEVFFEEPGKPERHGRWVGFEPKKGDILTYSILPLDTGHVVTRSNVRPAKDPLFPNLRVRPGNSRPDGGGLAQQQPVLMSLSDVMGLEPSELEIPKFSPTELLGLTFLQDTEDGGRIRAKVTRQILDRDSENHQNIKFLISCGDDAYEEILAYNELSDIIERQHDEEASGDLNTWTFTQILEHQGPLSSSNADYKGSSYNVMVLWSDGSKTWEPLNLIAKDDPVTLAAYAKAHDLLEVPGWKFLRRIARRAHVLRRMLNQARMSSRRNAVRYKFGVQVPRSISEAHRLDKENGNNLWAEAIQLEISQLLDYATYDDRGHGGKIPGGYQKIRMLWIFDVKQSGKRKARFVAGGHLTDPPKDSVYSSVVSLRSMRIVTFLSELNHLNLMALDIGNAYLEAYTKEKVCFVAGPEFGALAGHLLIIVKAQYGLKSSGARFHEKCADTLSGLGFQRSYADPDVWMRDAGDVYEYVCTWVDDWLCGLLHPTAFAQALQSDPYNFKLKGVGEPKYHLGGDFFRDSDGTLCYGANTYVTRLAADFKIMFDGETPPSNVKSPLAPNDHPELDLSDLCSPADTVKYQSLIGALQWCISLCRFDIANAVMTMSRYRAEPRVGHLERAKRIVGYLTKFPHAVIRFRTGIPDHESITEPPTEHDWMYTVYGRSTEEVPHNAPVPKGKPVRTTTFVDANLLHDVSTGKSVTGILHLLNQTPLDWFSKRQGQVETATYGSEFVAARTATEQITDLRYTLRMFGVPLDGPSWMFGDNQSVITSSTIPHSTLSKRWNALSYHRVREAVAAGYVLFHFISSKHNPADIMTKPLGYVHAWPHIDTLLFRKGETYSIAAMMHAMGGVSTPGYFGTGLSSQSAASYG